MEDDDEFGDLYTDVLRPLQLPSALQPPLLQPIQRSPKRPIDLNIQSHEEEILYGAPNSNPQFNFTSSHRSQTLVYKSKNAATEPVLAQSANSCRDLNLGGVQKDQEMEKKEGLAEGASNWALDFRKPGVSRVLETGEDVKLQGTGYEDPNLMDESGFDFVVEDRDDKDDVLVEKDEVLIDKKENFEKFGIEEVDTEIEDMGSEPGVPGLSIPGVSNADDRQGDSNEGNDWDSDSEDDLQIVLNDNHHVAMVNERSEVVGSDEDDEDGDPLVVVADTKPGHQPMEEREWVDDEAQTMDGERRESGDVAKVNGGVAVAPKIGHSNHAYHPYHSQFKYVRPGAAPMPGVAPVGSTGVSGQIRPPVNVGPVAGFGRGDWRPTGIKNASSMQKNLHQVFGMPVWGNTMPGRGFGSGLEFTLPSYKTIFEVDFDSFEEKPWRLPGLDISDYFNFGLNEESWKDYCKKLEQLRLEATMQRKIHVYESGRTEQEFDPDLPPELAAAAAIHVVSSENAILGKMDAGQSDMANGPARVRPPLPTGRAIQVETGSGERLPSIDTRPPRIRDSDAIIEIVLQDSTDGSSFPENDVIEQPEKAPSMEDFRGGQETEGDITEEASERFDGFLDAYNRRKRELVGTRASSTNSIQDNLTEGDQNLPLPRVSPVPYSSDSREQLSKYPGRDIGTLHEERQTKGRARDKSPNLTRNGSTLDKKILDNQKEDSVESVGGKHSHQLSSPVTVGSAEEPDVEPGDGLHDELVLADGTLGIDREKMALGRTTATDTHIDENPLPLVKKQKLSSRIEQSSLQEIDDGGDLKAARSSENRKTRSECSRDYKKLCDSIEEEEVQHGRSTRMGNLKKSHGEDEQGVRREGRDERHEREKYRMAEKDREGSYSRRDSDPHLAHHLHTKAEGIDKHKERDNFEGAWQRRDDGRGAGNEDTRKRQCGDELGSRHRNKLQESEKMDKVEHLQLRKQFDIGYSRGYHDKDVGSRHREMDDNLKSRYEHMDDLYSKTRKTEEHLWRDTEREELLHGCHRENTSRRKRERDDSLDLRSRDDHVRTRDDDKNPFRHKEDGWILRERGERQRERDERHRLKQSHEKSLSKREREEGRGGVRSGRAEEDKTWVSHARVKDEYKGSDRDHQFKDVGWHNEQLKKRDRVEDGSHSQHRGCEDVHARGNQLSNERSRKERASTCSDRADGSDNNRVREKNRKEYTTKSKDSEGGNQNSIGPSKRNQEDQGGHMNELVILKGGTNERGKHREDASSDDEQQDSRRGRSKLERWASHKERDFSISSKSSTSLKVTEVDKCVTIGSSRASRLPEESSKTVETIDNQHPSGNQKDAGDPEIENVDVKSLEDRRLDTVAKLKRRSERFKLPMPSEKEAVVIKKMEGEPLSSTQSEACADLVIKPERPARKRRWISK